ncbi:hypothetical protein C8J56DRAFT_1030764 [Mycena floridula]|nr:hypothetical protein C8J56DRAFT_1030764 [Mycena floridula]
MRREQYNFSELLIYFFDQNSRLTPIVDNTKLASLGLGAAQSKALVGYSGSEMQREICENEDKGLWMEYGIEQIMPNTIKVFPEPAPDLIESLGLHYHHQNPFSSGWGRD